MEVRVEQLRSMSPARNRESRVLRPSLELIG